MGIGQKLRKFWHDVFYRFASDRQVDFAMKCRDIVAKMDLHQRPTSAADRIRFQLHLSLCQSCTNYDNISMVFTGAMQTLPPSSNVNLQNLNQNLVKKYASQKK